MVLCVSQFKDIFVGADPMTFPKAVLCGACAGMTEVVFIAPSEVVKIRLQVCVCVCVCMCESW